MYSRFKTVFDRAEGELYLTEILNHLTPPHKLIVQVGAPVILLRNINSPEFNNGTRLRIRAL